MAYRGLTIRNKNEQIIVDEITKAHTFLNDALKVKTNLHFGRTAVWGRNVEHRAFYQHNSRDIIINFRNLYGHPLSIILEILGHEMRHAVQHKTGMLVDYHRPNGNVRLVDHTGIWMNENIKDTYFNLPWEIDARKFQKQYAQLVIDAGIIKKETLKVILPGAMVEIYLEQDTFKMIKEKYPNSQAFTVYETEEEYQNRINERDEYIKSLGFEREGDYWKFIGDESKKKAAIKKVKNLSKMKRQQSKHGFCYLTIDQLPENFKKWTKKSFTYAWNNLEELMRKQYVPYKKRLLTIDDFVS